MGMALALCLISAASVKAQIITDNGFESPDLGSGTGAYAYGDQTPLSSTVTGWTFVAGAGIAANGSLFDVAGATQGQTSDSSVSTSGQAGFLQGLSSITQSVYLSGGEYSVSFTAEGRGGVFFPSFTANEITVSLGGTQLFDATPPPTFFVPETTTQTGDLAPGNYDLTFSGITNADATTFIDNVQIDPISVPEPCSMAFLALALIVFLAVRRLRGQTA